VPGSGRGADPGGDRSPLAGGGCRCKSGPEVCAIPARAVAVTTWAFFAAGERLLRPGPEAHHTGSAAELADALAGDGRKIRLVGEVDRSLAAAVQRWPECCAVGAVASLRRAGVLAELASTLLSRDQRQPGCLAATLSREPAPMGPSPRWPCFSR
jgi:hypothetical protein